MIKNHYLFISKSFLSRSPDRLFPRCGIDAFAIGEKIWVFINSDALRKPEPQDLKLILEYLKEKYPGFEIICGLKS